MGRDRGENQENYTEKGMMRYICRLSYLLWCHLCIQCRDMLDIRKDATIRRKTIALASEHVDSYVWFDRAFVLPDYARVTHSLSAAHPSTLHGASTMLL